MFLEREAKIKYDCFCMLPCNLPTSFSSDSLSEVPIAAAPRDGEEAVRQQSRKNKQIIARVHLISCLVYVYGCHFDLKKGSGAGCE